MSAVKMLADFAGGPWCPFSPVSGTCPNKQVLQELRRGLSASPVGAGPVCAAS